MSLLAPAQIVRPRNDFNSTDPTIGLRYQPLQDVVIRGSFGTGFLPPGVNQLTPNAPNVLPGNLLGIVDPFRGNQVPTANIALLSGGNPNLRPEESRSWSAGLIVTPHFVPDLRMSLDYTRIRKRDNIANFTAETGFQGIINSELLFPGHVIRGAVTPGDPFGVGQITGIDLSLTNLARTDVSAFDLALDYREATDRLGTFDFFLSGTRQTHYETQTNSASPLLENVSIGSFPLKTRASAGVSWTMHAVTLSWNSTYYGSYLVVDPRAAGNAVTLKNQGNGGEVSGQTFHDLSGSYRFGADRSLLLANTEVQLGIKNIFDQRPSFDAGNGDLYSAYGDPRLASYYLSLKRTF